MCEILTPMLAQAVLPALDHRAQTVPIGSV